MKTVLLTGVGGPAGRALAAQLRPFAFADDPVFTIGADMRELASSDARLVLRIPPATSSEYLATLHHLLEYYEVDLLIPTVSEELPIVAVAAPLLAGVRPSIPGHPGAALPPEPPRRSVVIASAAAVALASDKLLTMQTLRRAGVGVPDFADAGEFHTAASALRVLGGPLVLKPRISRGARGVSVVRHASDPWPASGALIQRFAPGTEYCVQIHRPVGADDGAVVVLRKTALSGGTIGNAVSCVVDEGAVDVGDIAWAAVPALGVTGPADVDVRRDDTGLPVVLEVNARFGAQSAAAPAVLSSVLRAHGMP